MANSFKPLLNMEAERAAKEERVQEQLHDKYKDVPKETKIVENRAASTVARVLGTILRTVIEIIVFLFAAVGILSLIFPSTREALASLWSQLMTEIGQMF